MTPAKLEVLRMLSTAPRFTTKQNTSARVSGRLAALLVRDGLAQWGRTVELAGGNVERPVEITERGRRALEATASK